MKSSLRRNSFPLSNSQPLLGFSDPVGPKSCFAADQAWGPEAKALLAKSIGGERILPGDSAGLPQNGAGRSGARPGAPTSEYRCSRRRNVSPARSKKRDVPHDFCAQCPCFRAGHGLKFNRLYTCLGKREGGQVKRDIDRRIKLCDIITKIDENPISGDLLKESVYGNRKG